MTRAETIHLAIGGVATLIFLVQNLSSLTGGADSSDGGVDFDGDVDGGHGGDSGGHSLSAYLSIRNMVAFFMGYGWVAFAALRAGKPEQLSALLGFGSGCVFVCVSIAMLRFFVRFQEDGTVKMASLVGKTGTVYIAPGAGGSRAGKVFMDTSAGRMELQARTSEAGDLKPGEIVTVEKVEDGLLWVRKRQA